jgi:hypothetical protein
MKSCNVNALQTWGGGRRVTTPESPYGRSRCVRRWGRAGHPDAAFQTECVELVAGLAGRGDGWSAHSSATRAMFGAGGGVATTFASLVRIHKADDGGAALAAWPLVSCVDLRCNRVRHELPCRCSRCALRSVPERTVRSQRGSIACGCGSCPVVQPSAGCRRR